VLVLLSRCTGDSATTHPLDDLMVTSGERRPRAFQLPKQRAQVPSAQATCAQESDVLLDRMESQRVIRRRGVFVLEGYGRAACEQALGSHARAGTQTKAD